MPTLRRATDRTEGAAAWRTVIIASETGLDQAVLLRADLPDQAALPELVQRIAGLGLEVINVQIAPPPPTP